MKKSLLTLAIFASAMAMAQTEKGSVLAGGGLNLRTGDNASQFAFTPTVGIFAANNFVIGGTMNFVNTKRGDVKNNSFGIGPFARYCIGKTNTKKNCLKSNKKKQNERDNSKIKDF